MSYQLDTYSDCWAEQAWHALEQEGFDRVTPFTILGATRFEDFELVRRWVHFAQEQSPGTVQIDPPACLLPDAGSCNLYDEDPVAGQFLQRHLPGDVQQTILSESGADATLEEWLESFIDHGQDWSDCFDIVMRAVADDLHLHALLTLRDLLARHGYAVAPDCRLELREHDGLAVLADEPGYERVVLDAPLRVGPWLSQVDQLAALYFESKEQRERFIARAR